MGAGETQLRQTWVQVWVEAMMVRRVSDLVIDDGRAGTKRFAEEGR
jgi:hypothetical protein